jgi:hypothetical protein
MPNIPRFLPLQGLEFGTGSYLVQDRVAHILNVSLRFPDLKAISQVLKGELSTSAIVNSYIDRIPTEGIPSPFCLSISTDRNLNPFELTIHKAFNSEACLLKDWQQSVLQKAVAKLCPSQSPSPIEALFERLSGGDIILPASFLNIEGLDNVLAHEEHHRIFGKLTKSQLDLFEAGYNQALSFISSTQGENLVRGFKLCPSHPSEEFWVMLYTGSVGGLPGWGPPNEIHELMQDIKLALEEANDRLPLASQAKDIAEVHSEHAKRAANYSLAALELILGDMHSQKKYIFLE